MKTIALDFIYKMILVLQNLNFSAKDEGKYWRQTYWNQFLAFLSLKKTITGKRVPFSLDFYGNLECPAIYFIKGVGRGTFSTPYYDCTEIVLTDFDYTGFMTPKELDTLATMQIDLYKR